MYSTYTDMWDCCEYSKVPIFPFDFYTFQTKLKPRSVKHSIYGFLAERRVRPLFLNSGHAGVPQVWLTKACLVYNLTLKKVVKYNTSDTVLKGLQKSKVIESVLATIGPAYKGPLRPPLFERLDYKK